jgi:hypothetical protein
MGTFLVIALALQAAPPAATCRSVGLDPPRTWHFDKPGAAWQVTHWRGATRQGEVRLVLPLNAMVDLSKDRVTITARTSNGGIDVALAGTPERAQLDIYVSYELEVNVDASLTPAIDAINTEGRLGVTCEIG